LKGPSGGLQGVAGASNPGREPLPGSTEGQAGLIRHGFLTTELVIQVEDQGFKKRTRADGSPARYLHWEGKPAFTAKNRYALPAKMLVPKDFNFDKELAPYFPTRGVVQNHNVQSDNVQNYNSAGDGADRSARTGITPEPETPSTGEQTS
jgi:hypothetical protein